MSNDVEKNSNSNEVSHVVLSETLEVYLGQTRTFRLSQAGGLFMFNDPAALLSTRDAMLQGVRLINQFLGGGHAPE